MDNKYLATKDDGKDISRLLESPTDAGLIQAVYTRRPDAYESYMKESGEARIFAYKNDGRLVATCAELIRDVYVNGEVKKSAYICGAKTDPNYNGFLSAGKPIIDSLKREDVDFYYCTVMSANPEALNKFKKLKRIMSLNLITTYTSYIFSTRIKIKVKDDGYIFRQATSADMPLVLEYLKTEGKKKDLFPVINSLDDFYNLKIENFYLLMDKEKVVACGCLWDVTDYKQYNVVKYRGIAKLARFINPILTLARYPSFPKENTKLDLPFVSFLLCEDNNESLYKIFLKKIIEEVKKKYKIFLFSIPKNHCLLNTLNKLAGIKIDADIYELKFLNQESNITFNNLVSTENGLL